MLHGLITLVLCLVLGWLGGLIGVCWFIAREHTQAEYRWIAKYGQGKRANMPWWGGFDYRVYTWDALLDWIIPVLVLGIYLTVFNIFK